MNGFPQQSGRRINPLFKGESPRATLFIFRGTNRHSMRQLLLFFLLFPALYSTAQTGSPYSQLLNRFEQWKAEKIKAGKYATAANCNTNNVTRNGYKGPVTGIPAEFAVHFADINGDKKMDALFTFHPVPCDGGNALMNAQDRVLILSRGTGYYTDDKFIGNIEGKKDGWLTVTGATEGTLSGTYYNYGPDDGRCCPSIRKPFTIDFKTRQITIEE